MSFRVSHKWNENDVVYYDNNKIPILKIGAYTYTGELDITDYRPWMHPEQEPGMIEIGRFCSVARFINLRMYGNIDYRNVSQCGLRKLLDTDSVQKVIKRVPQEIIRIGNEVWIGDNVTILNNVAIGHGAVVGLQSVVTQNVPPYAIVAGNPARIKKFRFTEKQIEALLAISWWNWSKEKIVANHPWLLSADIDAFIERFSHDDTT
ncbi:MAG: CatB-related O-acetyltransferase [Magnetococcales bacterium]|nr:CatB-related O-acetyltransferase [Magnetococcales bacterium]